MEDIKKVSFTELSTYTACPLKWFIKYKLNVPTQTSKSLLLGSLYHELCKNILSEAIDESYYAKTDEDELLNKSNAIIRDFIDRALANNKISDEDISYLMSKSQIMPTNIFNYFKNNGIVTLTHNGKPLVEFELLCPIKSESSIANKYYIKGIIDCVIKDKNNNIILLDHKTSKKKYSDYSIFFSAQLNLYSYLISVFINTYKIPYKPNKIGYLVYTLTNTPDITLHTADYNENQDLVLANCSSIIDAMNTIKPYPTLNNFIHELCEYKELCYKYNYFTSGNYNEIMNTANSNFDKYEEDIL